MPHILKNDNLEVHIDLPLENYRFSRFDWTGKIAKVKFQNTGVTINERIGNDNPNDFGKGLYSEFGIDTALGFEETGIGGWFHKIGVGLLKKDATPYLFSKKYEIKPARFTHQLGPESAIITCRSEQTNGYSYMLQKTIELRGGGFVVHYVMENTGEKDIVTEEYAHNFMAIDHSPMGPDYVLRFPFQLQPEHFGEIVNPKEQIILGQSEIGFRDTPETEFFFSNLTGGQKTDASWELVNHSNTIAIRETGSFQTHKINLWGCGHVVSPELFFSISIGSGQSTEWSRAYDVYRIPDAAR